MPPRAVAPINRLKGLAKVLVSGYPTDEPEKAQHEFTKILQVVLPVLAERASRAQQVGGGPVEEGWKRIRGWGEEDFEKALPGVDRLRVLYVASKFMNNKAVGTWITDEALDLAKGKEVKGE